MMAVPKLLLASMTGAVSVFLAVFLTIALAGGAFAAQPTTQTPPVEFPVQIFPPGLYPLSPEREQALRAKDSFKECDACPEMVVVPKGSFMMGTPADEPEREPGEGPQHRVTFAQPFAVGRFAITFDEWEACVADGGCDGYKPNDQGYGRGRMPVANIDFAQAKTYLTWISKKVGRTYRLPSESEREYFTRAGTTTAFWFGNGISPKQANYLSGNVYNSAHNAETHDNGPRLVDSFAPNKFGLYQVHGNTREWTADCYNKRYTVDAPTDGSAWLDGNCNKRVARGGYWLDLPSRLRSGYREGYDEIAGYGFRVVRTLNLPQ
jgi:formylglycine-generating enzyme required for sulfatase activity